MNITLIGMPGVGKTTIGKELAKKLDFNFIDIDDKIVEKTKMKLQKLIEKIGDKRFIEVEENVVLELEKIEKTVISTGGSMIYSKKAMAFLKNKSKIVFLDSPLGIIENNLKSQETRGIIGLKNGLKALFDERLPLYEKYADIKISVQGNPKIEDIIKEIIKKLVKSILPRF